MSSPRRSLAILALLVFAGPVLAADSGNDKAGHDWPTAARDAADAMRAKYGPPQEGTATLLIWSGNGPWTRTVVHKMGAEHDFPAKHSDVLEQSLPYKVPPNFFGALATFNGSVIADRTRGTLTAYGASEAENILSLNLARKIVRGELNAEQARDAQVNAAREMLAGKTPDEAAKLTIEPQQEGDVADPDTAMILPPGAPR
jgi:hypothetical protein